MNKLTTWGIGMSQHGWAQTVGENSGYGYAGGFVAIVLGGGATNYDIYDLGGGTIAIADTSCQDPNSGDTVTLYWNTVPYDNQTEELWEDGGVNSNSIGAAQTFTLVNLGGGKIQLAWNGGASALIGVDGGWVPEQFGDGNASIQYGTPSGNSAFEIHGAQLPILIVSGSGYQLDLQNQDLTGVTIPTQANMQQVNLQGANLSAVAQFGPGNFTGAQMQGCNIGSNSMAGSNWTGANFTNTNLSTVGDWAQAQLQQAILSGANLSGLNMAGANLASANLTGANLDNTVLDGANLTGAVLNGASMSNTSLVNVNATGASFNGCDLSTTNFGSSPTFARSTTGRTTFENATVPAVIIGNNWSYLDLTGATITGIPTTISSLVADQALLPDGIQLSGVDLAGASFVSTTMNDAQLIGANLQGANFTSAQLEGADLSNSNLAYATLQGAYLIAQSVAGVAGVIDDPGKLDAAKLTGAFMINTNLSGAWCDGVDFSGTLFVTNAIAQNAPATAEGASANIAKFNNATLVGVVFDNAQLTGSNFAQSNLTAASFQSANLGPTSDVNATNASFYQANIDGINASNANMDGLDLQGATYSTAEGTFTKVYKDFFKKDLPIALRYQATILGNMNENTTCPDGTAGPCNLAASAAVASSPT